MMEHECVYCREDSEGYSTPFGGFYVRQDQFSREYRLCVLGKKKPQKINYCPMCGRALNESECDT